LPTIGIRLVGINFKIQPKKGVVMKSSKLLKLSFIIVLCILTGVVMALTSYSNPFGPHDGYDTRAVGTVFDGEQIIKTRARLIQDKVLEGGPGHCGMILDITAAPVMPAGEERAVGVDMVVVIDRSGSMQGRKLDDARRALLNLIEQMTPEDRFALVAYSDRAWRISRLTALNPESRRRMANAVRGLNAAGGTNLGAGLGEGIQTLMASDALQNSRKVLLISDGLANQGITDPNALGAMASAAIENGFTIGALGVGLDFNEALMTRIADHGGGQYHFMENPDALAAIFEKEWRRSRQVVASQITVRIPLKNGLRVVDAGGYPIRVENNQAIFHPGNLSAGGSRRVHLTLAVPTHQIGRHAIEGIKIEYRHQDRWQNQSLSKTLWVTCDVNEHEVLSSIKEKAWAGRVIENDFARLKEEVAGDIRQGEKKRALQRIEDFVVENQTINAAVGSKMVTDVLEKDSNELRKTVQDTFMGSPEAVMQKQKSNAKVIQYEGYQERRQKK
jgi:Ca-activated chloride channel family protein